MRDTKKTIPTSRAKTAWGLIKDVMRAMENEPKRMNMRYYINTDPDLSEKGLPVCGTTGCFAGWISLLRRGRSDWRALGHAHALLGSDIRYMIEKRGSGHIHVFDCGDDIPGNPGTARYMRGVLRRIRRFMKVNEKALKARKLPPIGTYDSER